MRINSFEKESIKEVIHYFDSESKVYLFGSRTDDSKKGGDIDLLVISDKITFEDKIKIRLKLFDAIGEQKIDLLVTNDLSDPFVKIAMNSGIIL